MRLPRERASLPHPIADINFGAQFFDKDAYEVNVTVHRCKVQRYFPVGFVSKVDIHTQLQAARATPVRHRHTTRA